MINLLLPFGLLFSLFINTIYETEKIQKINACDCNDGKNKYNAIKNINEIN